MIILGLDPGSALTGFGIIDATPQKIAVVDFGVIRTDPIMSAADRLHVLSVDLAQILEENTIECCAIEKLFFTQNRTTGIKVAQARGVLIETVRRKKINLYEYTPSEIKSAVTGDGKADKKQMQRMVQLLLGLKSIPKPDDAADALASAICHATMMQFHKLTTVTPASYATV